MKSIPLFIIIILCALFFIFSFSLKSKTTIQEVDGVLYYPDGNPVRNYEQMYIYLSTEE